MSAADTSAFDFESDPDARKRWGGSFLTVLALHLGIAAVAATWAIPMVSPEAPPPAMLIDMVPTPPAPAKPTEAAPEIKPKELPFIEKAEVVIHKPKPKPKPEPKIEKKKEPDPARVPDTRLMPAAPVRAQTPIEARPAPSPNYLSVLYSHLERYKRYPSAAKRRHQTGTATLKFSMDRQGHVLSATVDKSSGVAAFDREVLAMMRRAEPLPPAPADRPGETLEFVIPVVFNLQN